MDIKEIALKVAGEIYDVNFDEHKPSGKRLISFAEALVAEIAKQNEPVACRYKDHNGHWCFMDKQYGNNEPLYTFPPTAEQIANETAEACAAYCEAYDLANTTISGTFCAQSIRRGAWKEFKK